MFSIKRRIQFLIFITLILGSNAGSYSPQRGQSGQMPSESNPERLREFNIDRNRITLSGFSSGGTFAQMLQISYPDLFTGIAVFSHTYYRCGEPNGVLDDYDGVCTKIGLDRGQSPYNVNRVLEEINANFQRGLIGDPSLMANSRLYVFAGTRNFLFTTDQSLKILEIYSRFLRSPDQICTRVLDAELVYPTSNYGGRCNESASDNNFLANCGFSGAFESLNFILKNLKRPSNRVLQTLRSFNQREFFTQGQRVDLDDIGYYYIPTECSGRRRQCLLHFYFHGCLTGREYNGTSHIINTGILEVAEVNNIVMIFPQARSSPQNEIGCWDTFGVTGLLHATRQGAQVAAVHRMLSRVMENSSNGGKIDFKEPIPLRVVTPGSLRPSSSSFWGRRRYGK